MSLERSRQWVAQEEETPRRVRERIAVHEREALSGLLFDRDTPRKIQCQKTLEDTACLDWWPPKCQLEHSDLCVECRELDFKQAFHPPWESPEYPTTPELRKRLYKRDTAKYTKTIRDSRGVEWLVNDPKCQLCLYLVAARRRSPGRPQVGEYYILFHNEFEEDNSRTFRKNLGFDQSSVFQVYLSVLHPPLDFEITCLEIFRLYATVICHIGKPIVMEHTPQIVQPHFQRSRAKSWLEACKTDHPVCLEDKLPIPRTRLIHCETRKLISVNPDIIKRPRFAALSYVWGSNLKPINASKDDSLPDPLPLTISDALIVTRAIGLQYLWVDQYCIDQNDPEDKKRQIRQMDLIYKSADVTIIAAAGDSSDHGLPGVSCPRTDIPYPFTLNFDSWPLTFGASHAGKYFWKSGKWKTRGWTFQEALLSRRRMIFSDTSMHFECNHGGAFSENIVGQLEENEVCSDNVSRPFPDFDSNEFTLSGLGVDRVATSPFPHILDPFTRYMQLVTMYTTRELSYPADGLNAFRGAANELQRSDNSIYNIAGIPFVLPADQEGLESDWAVFTFSLGLSWCSQTGSSTPAAEFPTWSWANVRVWSVTWTYNNLKGFKLSAPELEVHGIENTLYLPRDMRIEFDQDGLKKLYTLPLFARACRDPGLDMTSVGETVPAALCFKARILSAQSITKMPIVKHEEQGDGWATSRTSDQFNAWTGGASAWYWGQGSSDFEDVSWRMGLLVHVNDSLADESTTRSDRVRAGDRSRWHCELGIDGHGVSKDLEARKCDLVLLNCQEERSMVLVVEWLGKPEDRPRAARRSGIVRFIGKQFDQFLACFSIEVDLRLV